MNSKITLGIPTASNTGRVIANPRSNRELAGSDDDLRDLFADSPATLLHEDQSKNTSEMREQVRRGNQNLFTATTPKFDPVAAQAAEDSIRDAGLDNHGHGGKSGLNPGEFF